MKNLESPQALLSSVMPSKVVLILGMVLVTLFAGCSGQRVPNWFLGDWVLDSKATLENMSSNKSENAGFESLVTGLQAMVVPLLSGMEMSVSHREMIITFNGQKTLKEIVIYKKEPDKFILKSPEGVLTEYHKTENGFWTTTDDGKLKVFFQRKQS